MNGWKQMRIAENDEVTQMEYAVKLFSTENTGARMC